MDVETLAKELHEAGRAAVEAGATVAADKFGEKTRTFMEWEDISETAREGRRIQARYLLDRYTIYLHGDDGVITCVYCGIQYPKNTPTHGRNVQALTDHIKSCEKHPMRKCEADIAMLRRALIGVVGGETIEELNGMEAVIRQLPVPDHDRMVTINAMQALINTMPT